MKQIFIIILLGLTIFSCVSTKKYSRMVDEKFTQTSIKNSPSSTILQIKYPPNYQTKNITNAVKSSFVPAILYWSWNSTINCKINPAITAGYLTNAIYKAADSLNFSNKFKDKTITLNVKKAPNSFTYTNNGTAISFIIFYTMNSLEGIIPANDALIVDYEIREKGKLLEKGTEMIENNAVPLKNVWKSTKKFTWHYGDMYKNTVNLMGSQLINKIEKRIIK